MNEFQIITLYCFIDDFVKVLLRYSIGDQIWKGWRGRRGPAKGLSLQEVITLNIMRFYIKLIDEKAFYRLADQQYRSYFPRLPTYANFLKASNASLPVTLVLMHYLLLLNRENEQEHTFFMDATPLSVCDNHYISSHKVTKGFAERGKTTRGWFYGFKLHGTCDARGTLLNLTFTPGNVPDNKETETITGGLEGLFVADAGYLLRKEVFEALFEAHKHILSATRKNMKRLMSAEQGKLLRERNIIETTWDVLKERFELVYHLARSMNGLFRHYCYSIISFLLRPIVTPKNFLSLPPLAIT
jgi:hypothetical protein